MNWFCKHKWQEIQRAPIFIRYGSSANVQTVVTYRCENDITHHKQVRLDGWVGLNPHEWYNPEKTTKTQ